VEVAFLPLSVFSFCQQEITAKACWSIRGSSGVRDEFCTVLWHVIWLQELLGLWNCSMRVLATSYKIQILWMPCVCICSQINRTEIYFKTHKMPCSPLCILLIRQTLHHRIAMQWSGRLLGGKINEKRITRLVYVMSTVTQ